MSAEIKPTDYFIKDKDFVTITTMGRNFEIQFTARANHEQTIQKLSKTQYLVLETGEIKDFNQSENRGENLNSLRKTMKKIRYLVNNNFHGENNELWSTLTYEKNMTDEKRLSLDFNKFLKRLKYYLEKKYPQKNQLEYLKVIEPQERGAWHIHMLFKLPNKNRIFIPKKDLEKLWGKGFVDIKSIYCSSNIGSYLSAYLTNVPNILSEEEYEEYQKALNYGDEDVIQWYKKNKLYSKGERLYWYPPGINIFSKSKGIKYPERKVMTYKKARTKYCLKDTNLTFRKSLKIKDNEKGFENTLVTESYNTWASNGDSPLHIRTRCNKLLAYIENSKEEGTDSLRQELKDEIYKVEHRFEAKAK